MSQEITPEQRELNEAIALAAEVHKGQVRHDPDGRPYICHVLDVVNAIPKHLHTTRLVAALHDTVEDIDEDRLEWLMATIGEKFGHEVLNGVLAMTHVKDESLNDEAALADYLKYVTEDVLDNPHARIVKLADNYANMKDRVGQFMLGGAEGEKARKKLHQYARSMELLTREG